ncbi:MAG: Holliday junction branch migration protein RuvA [Peptoniphilaceae bacterium]|nr:Holliday junction branch migration protein RuvA [Peptoniphilaceae bacterium]MDY6019569.1 Holliday junction branch migration protein RuvA [Anaerococcus sp.]
MISYIIGDVKAILDDSFIIENNKIGYRINTSLATLESIELNNEYKIYTVLNVRENDISLYGFYSLDELEMYELLVTVSSIGPKNAIAVLSTLSVNEIKRAIVNNDIDYLAQAKGIGKKTASRIILELVDKVKGMHIGENHDGPTISNDDNSDLQVAKEALINLGYQRNDVEIVLNELKDLDLDLEMLVKESLKRLI